MGEAEYELVDNAVNPNSPTDELEVCVIGVIEDEVVPVEVR
jgi:hypothetical protein